MEHETHQQGALEGFKPGRILNEDPSSGVVALVGRFADKEGDGVVVLSRQQLDAKAIDSTFFNHTNTSLQFENDIYRKFTAIPPPAFSKLNVDVIFPATQRHINKYSSQNYHVVQETPELYNSVTKPYIDAIPADRLKWVYNILDGSAEAERQVLHDLDPDTGFMLSIDMKWADQNNLEQLYCVAMCNRRDVPSIRSLTTEHLPLLENIRDKGTRALEERYGISGDQLRIFVHYQPSYYHFHVHFVNVKVISGTVAAGKAILLEDVIDNIKLWPDYFQKRTLTLTLGENEELLKLLQSKDKRQKTESQPAA